MPASLMVEKVTIWATRSGPYFWAAYLIISAVSLVEVHVDIGHLSTSGIEEAFEDQPVGERVEVGDPQAIRDDRSAADRDPG